MSRFAIILLTAFATSHVAAQDGRLIEIAGASAQVGQAHTACRQAKTGRSGVVMTWQVRQPDSALQGGAIAETSREQVDGKYPICVFDQIRASNVRTSVDITPLEGEIDRAGGLAVRVRNENNYYLVRANALENNVRFYRVIGVDAPVASGRPQRLQIEAVEDVFTVTFDGRRMFVARDSRFLGEGAVALWSKADSLTEFSALSVTVLQK